MKPFDLQEALNGAPVKLQDGTKAFVLHKLNTKSEECLMGYYIDQYGWHYQLSWRENGRSELDQIDDANIVGMWEEPELTSEQVLEKAYQEDLKVSLDGQDVYIIIGKAKDGSYLLGSEKSDSYVAWSVDFGNPEICQEDTAEPPPKSDTITFTLPKPFRPKVGNAFYFISDLGEVLVAHFVPGYISHVMAKDTGRCFRRYDDAKAWLDAMKNALDD